MAHLPSDFTDMFQFSANMKDAGQSETKWRKDEGQDRIGKMQKTTAQGNLLGKCWEEGLWGGLVDCLTQLMLGGGLVRKEAVK